MTSYVAIEIRRLVIARANGACEYCLIHSDDTFYGCQIEHVIAEKHGGNSELRNLALACVYCNRHKGSDIGSIALTTKRFTRVFNPRTDNWTKHFKFQELYILPILTIGEVTTTILQFNKLERLLEREAMKMDGRFPPNSKRENYGN